MSRFYGTMVNRRGNPVTAMSPDSAHLCGWNAGVKVMPVEAGDKNHPVDGFTIWATYGSNGNGPTRLIGTLVDSSVGPVFVPAEAELTEDDYNSAASG